MPLNLGTGYGIDTLKPGSAATTPGLDAGLLAYWNMNEASGTRFDASWNARDLSVGTAPPSAAGLNGNGASFTSTSLHYLQSPDNVSFNFLNNPFTIAGWFKPSVNATTRMLVTKFSASPNVEFQLRLQTDNRVYWYMYNAGSPVSINTGAGGTVTVGTWAFIVAGRNGNTSTLILNNGTPVTIAFAVPLAAGITPLTLGANGQLSAFTDGVMDDWGIWNRWLSAAEITTLYNAGAGREYPLP